jgi:hypothetical protein
MRGGGSGIAVEDIDATVVRARLEIAGDLSAYDLAVVCMQFGRAENIPGRDRTHCQHKG